MLPLVDFVAARGYPGTRRKVHLQPDLILSSLPRTPHGAPLLCSGSWETLSSCSSGDFSRSLPLCLRQRLRHLLSRPAPTRQPAPPWLSAYRRWPSCLLFGDADLHFRGGSGFLLLLFLCSCCHPLFGFSALPSPE